MITTNTLKRATVLLLLAGVVATYVGLVTSFGGRVAIEIMNAIVLSLAAGIATAYWPVVRLALRKELLDGGDVLSVGIFLSWTGAFVARAGSILWRSVGKPVEWLDSSLWGAHIMLTCMGAMCHIFAPEAIEGRVPTRQWVKVGLMVAGGIFLAMLFLIFNAENWFR